MKWSFRQESEDLDHGYAGMGTRRIDDLSYFFIAFMLDTEYIPIVEIPWIVAGVQSGEGVDMR